MEDSDLRVWADKAAIHELLVRYGHLIDDHDLDALGTCFDNDVIVELNGGQQVIRGLTAFIGALQLGHAQMAGRTTHFISNVIVHLSGDTADAASSVINFAPFLTNAGQVSVRGLRYADDLARTSAGWRIIRRRHVVDWQFDAPLTVLATLT